MYFLSVSILMLLVSFFSSIEANSTTNSSSTTNLTKDDLVLALDDLVNQYKDNIEKLQFRLRSLNNNLLSPSLLLKDSLLASVTKREKKKAAFLEIRRLINAKLNYTGSGQEFTEMDFLCSTPQWDDQVVCERTNQEFLDPNPIIVLNVDIARLDREIAVMNKKLVSIDLDITRAKNDITPVDLELKKKTETVNFLSQLYHV